MTNRQETGPTELSDLEFRDYVLPPTASYEDTMRLYYGWRKPSKEELELAPYVSNTDGIEEHIQHMLLFAADTYTNFGGGEGKLLFGASYREVLAYVENYENKGKFLVFGFEGEIAGLAHRYICGQGEDYNSFHQLQNML